MNKYLFRGMPSLSVAAFLAIVLALDGAPATVSRGKTLAAADSPSARPAPAATATAFDPLADSALQAMRQRATELGIGGVAVVAYFEGDTVKSWTSKMIVVGRMRDEPSRHRQRRQPPRHRLRQSRRNGRHPEKQRQPSPPADDRRIRLDRRRNRPRQKRLPDRRLQRRQIRRRRKSLHRRRRPTQNRPVAQLRICTCRGRLRRRSPLLLTSLWPLTQPMLGAGLQTGLRKKSGSF